MNSFSKAASSFGMTQPSISYSIKELEQAWGGELFYRTGRGVVLSEFGLLALPHARSLLAQADSVFEELSRASKSPAGRVDLGVPHSLMPVIVPRLLEQLGADAPGIHLHVHEAFTDQIERWIASGEVQVGVCSIFAESDGEQESELFYSPLVLASPSQELPRTVAFGDLGKYPLVLPAAPNGMRRFIEAIARRLNTRLNVVVDADSIYSQKQICKAFGCMMISAPRSFHGDSIDSTSATSLIVKPRLGRHVNVATSTYRPLTLAAREVAKRINTILRSASRDEEQG